MHTREKTQSRIRTHAAASGIRAALLALLLAVMATGSALAAQEKSSSAPIVPASPASPVAAILSPSGGLVQVEETLPVVMNDDMGILSFVLPGGAENLQISVPGHTIARWTSTPQALERKGHLAHLRAELSTEINQVNGKLAAVKAQLALWETPPGSSSYQDLTQREKKQSSAIPELIIEQANLESLVAVLRQQLDQMPLSPEMGQRITIALRKPVTGKQLKVAYSYQLNNCGWRPVYSFDARTGSGKSNETSVRLMAEIWQLSGIDWSGAQLTLISRGEGPREPASLGRWVIDSQVPVPQPARAARKTFTREAAVALSVEADAVPAEPPVVHDGSAVFARWNLAVRGLPEGRSRLLIVEDMWKTPLQWLARPIVGDSRVWLMGKYSLPSEQSWPDGAAEFCVDGQGVGQGFFTPRGGEATLYFGPDPRVHVNVIVNSKRRGESGFIEKSRTWTWAWTYVLTNTHKDAINVRVERPMPMIVDQGVSVSYNDSPASQQVPDEHMLLWNIEVPGDGKAEIKHSVSITSSKEMPMLTDIP
ncbi:MULTISPECIES: DUF4139 domain-containing protein [Desulfovibrio]|uniref:DUF4139 domain-containing protein n=1 Tax=Desulfovibrio desulfuricans TaxID=876 RepID=A0AA94HTL3_DESDE|nr:MULTISPECIES: DUF4139 domain-containing protein [Desulfovibrio]ATD81179.1 DUF4139 domain-containing protein [Desulfovibrio sp. G11]SFW57211.1 protein of unknown function [Desulfovibrio desulfuricans]SPD36804.1 Protein of unknown function (DUF4139) [Desulfovibrio sp. G11]